MLKSVKLGIEKSEKTQRINELMMKDEMTPEERSELDTTTKRAQEIEVEYRAALHLEDDAVNKAREKFGDSPEDREKMELRSRVQVGNYISAAQEQRSADGAELEYAQACNVRPGRFPLHLLVPEIERRATTDVDAQSTQQSWLDRLFSESLSMNLGVTFKSVMPGTASLPVTTAGSNSAQIERAESKPDSSWTVSVINMKPKRHTGRLAFSMEDDYRIPGLEGSLRRDMQLDLAEKIDRSIFIGATSEGSGTTADITGLTTATGVVEKELTQTEKTQADEVLSIFTELVDGKHATMIDDDLSIVLAVGANTLWGGTVLEVTSETASVFKTLKMFLMENGVTWRTRGDIEAATANGDWGGFVGRMRGIEGSGCAAIWDEGQFIRDEYTGAAKGEVGLTLHYFWDFALPRASNFARIKFVT